MKAYKDKNLQRKAVRLGILLLISFLADLSPGFLEEIRAEAESSAITMATTTSTQNSGLLDVLLHAVQQETGIAVKVITKGTGAAIRDGMDGNVDVIFVHALQREEEFVREGYGSYRLGVMHNDFVILGPADDPAGIRGMSDVAKALTKIASAGAPFVSRGDDSGTHTKEQELWKTTGITLTETSSQITKKGKPQTITFLQPADGRDWYLSIGQGMGKTITFADEKRAYTLADRGTYLNYAFGGGRRLDLETLVEGDNRLHNPYGIIPVNPARHPNVEFDLADRFARWLVSPGAQKLISDYRIQGRQAFFPDAVSPGN